MKVNLQALILMLSTSLKNVEDLDFSTNHLCFSKETNLSYRIIMLWSREFLFNFNDEAISLIEAIYN